MAASVQVDPPYVEFADIEVGRVYRRTVTATNSGKTSKKMLFGKPQSKLFKFTAPGRAKMVAPGLSVSGVLEFTAEGEEKVKDRLLLYLDPPETIEIPLLVFPKACLLLMDPELDFGCVAANSKVMSRYHPIINQGSAPGAFQLQYQGDPSIAISPCDGVMAAGATQWLKVELRADRPKMMNEKALVKLQNGSSVVLHIKAEVLDTHLEIFDLQGAPLPSLSFGPLYFGTSLVRTFVLRNNSAQVCDWVCLLQDTAAASRVGADLQKSAHAALLETMQKRNAAAQDLSRVFVCIPEQGQLEPHGQTTLAVRFSPVFQSDNKMRDSSSIRQDYCLFLLFESVRSKHGFTHPNGSSGVELAVTGSGLTVSLVPRPSDRFAFPACVSGQRVDLLCVLHNFCPQLPVSFNFRRLAHFTAEPPAGTVPPGRCQDVVLSFTPRQQGHFRKHQEIDVFGYVAGERGETQLQVRSFHTVSLYLSAVCCSDTTYPLPNLNPGITPKITNPTGLWPYVRASEMACCHGMVHASVLNADRTRLHIHHAERSSQSLEEEEFLAFPNDRAGSIRPASPNRQYRTIFTGVHRYSFLDPAYALTEEEEQQRQQHRQIYADIIRRFGRIRLQKLTKRPEEKVEDIGMIPGHGLVPPRLRVGEMEADGGAENVLVRERSSPARSHRQPRRTVVRTQQVSDVMNPVPSSSQEVADCNRKLTALELYQVDVGPSFVDFGEVCVRSLCVQELQLANHLPAFVWVQLEADCPELQGTSPLSHVLPPGSSRTVRLAFQSHELGEFYRPVAYTVNRQHPGQILVQAQVVPVALQLAASQVVLRPNPNLLAASGYRGSVTLRNHRNHPAVFTWQPVVTESGVLFSIRPATGTVEPYSELDCEVVWHPSFSSPAEGDFDVQVLDGNTQRLHCTAKVGSTSVRLAEELVLFQSVPLNSPSTRTAVLHNNGPNHAYYQVLDVSPLPGMVLSPAEGVVPSGGQAVIYIYFYPDSIIRFEVRVEIAVRKMKSVELRVGGSVELLTVHFSATSTCDMDVPLTRGGPSPLPAPSVSTSSSSATSQRHRTHIATELHRPVTMATQWEQPTEPLAPLELIPSSLQFYVEPDAQPPGSYTQKVELRAACKSSVCWPEVLGDSVDWWFDPDGAAAARGDGWTGGLCTVTPSSGSLWSGQSICLAVTIGPEAITSKVARLSLPLYLGDEERIWIGGAEGQPPYRELLITINQGPIITVHPPQILLTPVPLESGARATFTLLVSGYPSGTTVSALVDEVELEDGMKIQPFSVVFPEGNAIPARDQRDPIDGPNQEVGVHTLTCSVSFSCAVPQYISTSITFTDHLDGRFQVNLCAITDNCLLTVWPYLALHGSKRQIVLKSGAAGLQAIFQCCHVPSPASGLASSSSSFDHHSSANKNLGSESVSVNVQAGCDRDASSSTETRSILGVPDFPAPTSEEGLYYEKVLLAVERWFSFFGWPNGLYPISVPHTLRRVKSIIQKNNFSGRIYRVTQNKDPRSVVDMVIHLTGRQIPTIPRFQTFSKDIDKRTKQLLEQHEAVLAFLRAQGACLSHIQPEYLLDVQEFNHWCSQKCGEEKRGLDYRSVDYESLSKRSWTDVLVQIYKVFVLFRVSGPDPTLSWPDQDGTHSGSWELPSSNIYSSHELQLLAWLNRHFQNTRAAVWGNGDIPSARWIVNFDLDLMDGLVLAALLSSYCPYLISSHFQRMYTSTSSLEQILHNNIIVVQALTLLSLNMDIQPTDLTDPNPVQMLMLCVHLYERLPHYLPLHTITLSGSLHSTFSKQVRFKSPASKPLKYQALFLGDDAHLFSLSNGSTVSIPPRASVDLTVQYRCSSIRPMDAVLLLVSSSAFGLRGVTLAFRLKTHISHIKPTNPVKCSSLCYKLKTIYVPITNSFSEDADFRVVLVESTYNPLKPEKEKENFIEQASSKSNGGKSDPGEEAEGMWSDPSVNTDGDDSEFLSSARTVSLKTGQTDVLKIHYLPFSPATRYCSVLLICPQVGDLVYVVKATADLPPPSPALVRPSSNIISAPNSLDGDGPVPVVRLRCRAGQEYTEVLRLPLINMLWEQALAIWGLHRMSADERRRRLLTHTLHSTTVRAAVAARKLFKKQIQMMRTAELAKGIKYTVEVSLPQHFTLPSTVTLPIKEDTKILWDNPSDSDFVEVPFQFKADSTGHLTCQVVLKSWFDIRVYLLEALVTSKSGSGHYDCSTAGKPSITQDVHMPPK